MLYDSCSFNPLPKHPRPMCALQPSSATAMGTLARVQATLLVDLGDPAHQRSAEAAQDPAMLVQWTANVPSICGIPCRTRSKRWTPQLHTESSAWLILCLASCFELRHAGLTASLGWCAYETF